MVETPHLQEQVHTLREAVYRLAAAVAELCIEPKELTKHEIYGKHVQPTMRLLAQMPDSLGDEELIQATDAIGTHFSAFKEGSTAMEEV